MSRTRVKICGVTRAEDGIAAVRLGADAIGLNFWPPGSRYVGVDGAAEVAAALPPLVTVVGVFVDPDPDEVELVLSRVPIGVLQFHGAETPDDCARYGLPYIKVVRVRGGERWPDIEARYSAATALMVDSYRKGQPGGTGETFDWTSVPRSLEKPLVLAGGLTASNVASAIRAVRPYAVDVSGGVEDAPGEKSALRIADFIREVQSVIPT